MGSGKQLGHGEHLTSGIALAAPGAGFEPQGRGEMPLSHSWAYSPALGLDMHQQSILFVVKEATSNIILLTHP